VTTMIERTDIDELMINLSGIYPAWKQAVATPEEAKVMKRVWYNGILAANLGREDLQRGISEASNDHSKYLPSLGQFIAWCRSGSELSKFQAWQMAALANDLKPINDPLVLEAAKRTGIFDIKNRDERDVRPLFFDHYADVLRERAQGVQFALPAPEPGPMPVSAEPITDEQRAENRRKIEEIMKGLGK